MGSKNWERAVFFALSDSRSISPDALKTGTIRFIEDRAGVSGAEAEQVFSEKKAIAEKESKKLQGILWVILMLVIGIAGAATSVIVFLLNGLIPLFIVFFLISLSVIGTATKIAIKMDREKKAVEIWKEQSINADSNTVYSTLKKMEQTL